MIFVWFEVLPLSYGHVETSVHLTIFFSGKLDLVVLTSWQQSFLNQGKEENDRRNYFTIILHESIGLRYGAHNINTQWLSEWSKPFDTLMVFPK